MTEHIRVEREGRVMRIRIAREEKKNALTSAMYAAMTDALEAAAADDDVRAVLFTGGPHVFTAGNDLNDFLDPNRDGTGVARFLGTLPGFDKPVVAAVNGHAVGIGTTMLLHCDLVFVGRGAKLKMPFVDLGAVPEFGSSLMLPLLVGAQRAAQLLLLSERFDGAEAVRLGLAAEVLDDADVEARALEAALQLADKAPSAVRNTKKLLRAHTADRLEAVMRAEGELFAAALSSPEMREAMNAIMEKRTPKF